MTCRRRSPELISLSIHLSKCIYESVTTNHHNVILGGTTFVHSPHSSPCVITCWSRQDEVYFILYFTLL
jgi:hypothetical protein